MHRFRGTSFAALGAVACFTFAAHAAPSPLDKLNVWQGDWRYKSEYKETKFSHAGTNTGEGKCAWLPFHGFMVCDFLSDKVDADIGVRDDDIFVLRYSIAEKAYRYTRIVPQGLPQEGATETDGSTWTVTMQIPRKSGGTAEMRDVYHFVSSDKRVMTTEISIDNGASWTKIGETVATREG